MVAVRVAPLLHAGAALSVSSFSVHPSTVIGLAVLVALYETVAAKHRAQTSGGPGPTHAQRAYFYIAVAVMLLSLNGWLHDLSDYYLFSAHMVQHLMLALVVAPLFVMGTPGWMLRPALQYAPIRRAAHWVTKPVLCFAIFNVTLAVWHLPLFYNAAMADHPLHIVQHLMLLVASVLLWWPILSPLPELPRLSYPGQMLYLFLTTIPMSIVAVYIALADTLLYPIYASAPRIHAISPMSDQLIGALIMWIPGGLYFMAIISVVFFRWQQRQGLDAREDSQTGWSPRPT
jgi:putative membrane protein